MLYSLAYAGLRLLLGNLMVGGRPNSRLGAEVLALRHQLRVLERQVGRPRWQPRVHLAGCTYSPTGAWVIQQARNLVWKLQDRELGKFLLRDRDSKFSGGFDNVFQSEGVEVIPLPYRSPRVNSFAERWVGTARREMVDQLLILAGSTWRGC